MIDNRRLFADAMWRKSSYSTPQGNNCVEVASAPEAIGVRDTKNRHAGTLAVSRATWTAFVHSVTPR